MLLPKTVHENNKRNAGRNEPEKKFKDTTDDNLDLPPSPPALTGGNDRRITVEKEEEKDVQCQISH